MINKTLTALLLPLVAGLSTAIGGLIAYILKRPKSNYLSFLLGFSAGVMIYISFVELLGSSIEEIGFVLGNISFFLGMTAISLVDRFIPHLHLDRKPDEFHENAELTQAAVLTAVGLALHNFPEGIAVMALSLKSLSLAVPITIAIAIHNIPEGIAVSVPVFYATGSRGRAFLYSLLSGIAEPIGALAGLFLLFPLMNNLILHFILGAVGGIMIFLSFDELLPISKEYGSQHLSTSGLFVGMLFMVFSLSLL